MCDINILKYLAANIIGTAFIALLGFIVGTLLAWLAGFFVPEGYKPYIVLIVFIGFMLGVPRIWLSNWRELKVRKLIEETFSEYAAPDDQKETKPAPQASTLDRPSIINRSNGLTFRNNVRGTIADYIIQEGYDAETGIPRPDILVTRIGTAIYWPKFFDPRSGGTIPQWVGFEPRIGDAVHAWWDDGQFYCEPVARGGNHAR